MRTIPLIALFCGCDPFDHWPDGLSYIEGPLWDTDLVAASDGLYVRLPHAGKLARVAPDGTSQEVDLDGAEPLRLVACPDGERVLVYATWPVCEEDPEADTIDECPEEVTYEYELDVVAGGGLVAPASVPPYMNALAFSDDGTLAVAYLDYESGEDLPADGLIDLESVVFVELDNEDPTSNTHSVHVGPEPRSIVFSEDGTKALVLSRSRVVVVDTEPGSETRFQDVPADGYPLTMDQDTEIEPVEARIVSYADEAGDLYEYALVSVQELADLFKIDLLNEAIDMISLDDTPTAMSVDNEWDRTALVYSGRSQVDILEHDLFNVETVELDDPANAILKGEGFAVLYNTASSTHDVYRLELDPDSERDQITEYVLENPVQSLALNSAESHAVGILRPETSGGSGLDEYMDSHYGLAIIDLATDDTMSLALQEAPVGLALVEDEEAGTTFALVLMEGVETLLMVDVADPLPAQEIELEAPPVSIGAMPDGQRFYIAHDSPLGLVSFLDPSTGEITTVSGFASIGLLPDDTLPRREEG